MTLKKEIALSKNILPACFNGNADVANQQLQEGTYGQVLYTLIHSICGIL
jgi:hypothetical protein